MKIAMLAALSPIMIGTWSIFPGTALSAPSAQQSCEASRFAAAAKYAACEHKARAKYAATLGGATSLEKFRATAGKCFLKYTATWGKIQAKAAGTGSTCDSPRFVDNGDGTVTDKLTALIWEKKTNKDGVLNGADRHDADNFYAWSLSGSAADGDLFTDFLASLNGSCFAGACDWRLPTAPELQTILLAPEPCGVDPCIEPVFGPTNFFSVSTTDLNTESVPADVEEVYFGSPSPGLLSASAKTNVKYGRAVRGGL